MQWQWQMPPLTRPPCSSALETALTPLVDTLVDTLVDAITPPDGAGLRHRGYAD